LFFVELGAPMIVASTIVPLEIFGRVRQVEPQLQEIDPQHPL